MTVSNWPQQGREKERERKRKKRFIGETSIHIQHTFYTFPFAQPISHHWEKKRKEKRKNTIDFMVYAHFTQIYLRSTFSPIFTSAKIHFQFTLLQCAFFDSPLSLSLSLPFLTIPCLTLSHLPKHVGFIYMKTTISWNHLYRFFLISTPIHTHIHL